MYVDTENTQRKEIEQWLRSKQPKNTGKTYSTYGKQYLEFTKKNEMNPDSDVALAHFMRHGLEVRKLSRSTLTDAIPSAVNDLFRYADTSPSRSKLVSEMKKVIKTNTASTARGPMTPISNDQLRRIVKKTQPSEESIRDTFLMIVMFLGFLRQSEATNLRFNDIWVDSVDGSLELALYIFVEKSKTDQARHGHTIILPSAPQTSLCPLAWFRMHCKVRRSPTHVFHNVKANAKRMGENFPYTVIKRCLTAIGVNPAGYGSHSLRRGGATAAVKAGVDIRLIKRHGNWKSDAVFLYIVDDAQTKLTVGKAILDYILQA
jgi:integrase